MNHFTPFADLIIIEHRPSIPFRLVLIIWFISWIVAVAASAHLAYSTWNAIADLDQQIAWQEGV